MASERAEKAKKVEAKESDSGDELERLAREELLKEAKRGKIRSETMGALGWRPCPVVANKRFLRNMLKGTLRETARTEPSKKLITQSTKDLRDGRKSESNTDSVTLRKLVGFEDKRNVSSESINLHHREKNGELYLPGKCTDKIVNTGNNSMSGTYLNCKKEFVPELLKKESKGEYKSGSSSHDRHWWHNKEHIRSNVCCEDRSECHGSGSRQKSSSCMKNFRYESSEEKVNHELENKVCFKSKRSHPSQQDSTVSLHRGHKDERSDEDLGHSETTKKSRTSNKLERDKYYGPSKRGKRSHKHTKKHKKHKQYHKDK